MKLAIILVAVGILLSGSSMAEIKPGEKREHLIDWIVSLRSMAMGIGEKAIQAPFGRYLLIRKGEHILALKLEKHIPSESEYGTSRFSWVSFSSGEQKASGVIDIEEGPSGSSQIRADGFKVEWSAGDWIYLDQESEIATTEATEPAEIFSSGIVSPANSTGTRGTIKWYSIDELKRWHEKARADADEKLRIEQGAAEQPATAGVSK